MDYIRFCNSIPWPIVSNALYNSIAIMIVHGFTQIDYPLDLLVGYLKKSSLKK